MFGHKDRHTQRVEVLRAAADELVRFDSTMALFETELQVPMPNRLMTPVYDRNSQNTLIREDYWLVLREVAADRGSASANPADSGPRGFGLRTRAYRLSEVIALALGDSAEQSGALVSSAQAALNAIAAIGQPLAEAEAILQPWRLELGVEPVYRDVPSLGLTGKKEHAERDLSRNLLALENALLEPGGDFGQVPRSESLQVRLRARGLIDMMRLIAGDRTAEQADPLGWRLGFYRPSPAPQGDVRTDVIYSDRPAV